jgi:hypothetical protein
VRELANGFGSKGARQAVLTTTVSYRQIAQDMTRSLDITAHKPQVAREAEYYLANIEKIKSIDDFIGNHRVFAFAMKAFGLGDMTYAKAFMRKALTEGIDNQKSFANGLSDPRYREFVETFNFARHGEATTIFERTRQATVDKYVRLTLEEDSGAQNEGVRLALYFQRKAPGITSPLGILADAALLKVAQTALGLPAATSALDIDKQAALIAQRLDIEDFKDPQKLDEFVSRFTSLWEIENPTQPPATPSIVVGQPIQFGLGSGLLTSLQNLKLGGG